MHIQNIEVINPALQPYISYYYLLSTEDDKTASVYQAFPSPNNPVGFFYDCAVQLLPEKALVTIAAGNGMQEIVVGNAAGPVQVVLQPGVKEFCIIFKPAGINNMQKRKMGAILKHDFYSTALFSELHTTIQLLLNGADAIAQLEDQLMQCLQVNEELLQLKQMVDLLNSDDNITVEEISQQLQLSYKKCYRLFVSHVGISPVQFRSILKFRKAVTNTVLSSSTHAMAGAAIDSGYYDQAHFINKFKKISQHTPKDFLSAVTLAGEGKLTWKFE